MWTQIVDAWKHYPESWPFACAITGKMTAMARKAIWSKIIEDIVKVCIGAFAALWLGYQSLAGDIREVKQEAKVDRANLADHVAWANSQVKARDQQLNRIEDKQDKKLDNIAILVNGMDSCMRARCWQK